MWVPCIGMALCSWLSFVDRQVLAILAPTILADTGLTAQNFTDAASFFFLAYTLSNPVWGSALDFVGLRVGMLLAVGVWTAASMSHAWMASFAGFALARAVLGFGEGATFPGGLRTAVESLPASMRARGIALSFSGGTIGAVMMPLLLGPLAIQYGWRIAFLATGGLGLIWLVIWAAIARPPFLPKATTRPAKMTWPNLFERRVWALVFSYALPAISPGPILTIVALYLNQRLQLTQADVNGLVWIPPLTWGIGYFFWGWAADKFAANNPRPIGMFLLLTIASLTLGLTTWTTSVPARDRVDLFFDLHRRRLPDGGAESGVVRVPTRAGGDDVRDRLRVVVAGELRAAQSHRPMVELDERPAMGGDFLAHRHPPRLRYRDVARAQQESDRGGALITRSREPDTARSAGPG